jgi:hypothetical protein
MKKSILFILAVACAITFLSLYSGPGAGDMKSRFFVYLNENKLEELSQKIDLYDVNKVFGLVFSGLNDQVDVYPTENYYYFTFHANGKEIWGNIRLAREMRDMGYLSFAYWEFDNFPQQMDDPNFFTVSEKLGPEHGVNIVRTSPFDYLVEYEGKKVNFKLNQLEQKLPDSIKLRKGEKFMMHTFDESGLRFYLLFNDKSDDFIFVLDEEEGLREEFINLEENYLYGKRTQFVFYDDKENNRKILIAVFAENIKRNNYYDGPFDQLADNYITEATGLKDCIDKAYPYARGRVNDFGEFLDPYGKTTDIRIALTPYYNYYSMEDLMYFIQECGKEKGDKFYSNLVYDYKKSVPE